MNKGKFSKDTCQKVKLGTPHKNLRDNVNSIPVIMKINSTWRSLPENFGKWQRVHQCFSRWSDE